ncbi:HpcH/HpaI aldolase/citrate lyase family protein [Varunaivibrio sulfuroxidans]|nr:CoA ester lyase [Varunaivibrio sulfuroxidans]WES30249.1 CoA ester lyase [Varunaivibrio sulfuroxidans]
MPGSNARALEKGRTLPADALILDLEDAVAPDAKVEARERVVGALGAGGYGAREIVVRTNALDTSWGYGDAVAVAGSGADALLLPKVESADAVRQAERILSAAGAPETTAIWCMMETPRGILHVEEIAAASPRVACLVMGTSDLAKDLHAAHTRHRTPMITALGLCLLAARAHGLAIVDGVHLDLDDDEGFERACVQGRDLGFDGKTLIHPRTIAVANRVFAPSPEDVLWSRRMIDAFDAARAAGQGVAVLDGKLIESLHVVEAKRLVALAEQITARGDGARGDGV